MQTFIAYLRFIVVVVCMAILVIAVLILSRISLTLIRYPIRRMWSRCLIAATGATLHINGEDLEQMDLKNTMLVSNHISWLDTVVILRLCFLRYIGKIEMLKWPLLKSVIKAGGTIFIDRSKKREIIGINQQVAQLLMDGTTVGLYPEGTTSDGQYVRPFKAPILEAARMAKSRIIPIVLSYRKEDDQLATEVTFAKVNWLTTVMNTLRLNNLVINVTVLPVVQSSDFKTRDELSDYLYMQIQTCYMRQQQSNSHYRVEANTSSA